MPTQLAISDYPTIPPPSPEECDVVVPYTESDRHLAREAIASIIAQQHVHPIIHIVADNTDSLYPTNISSEKTIVQLLYGENFKHYSIRTYKTDSCLGPYKIINNLVPFLQTEYLAIQDADDISTANRLWKQIEQLKLGYDMTSCAMVQEPIEGYVGSRHLNEPVIYPGDKLVTAPLGRCVNSTRTMKISFFKQMNGFAHMPCSGDFQFDNRALFVEPAFRLHGSCEVLAIRRLRPDSLSNGGRYKFGSQDRNEIAYKIIEAIHTMRNNPTLDQARQLGCLQDAIGPAKPL